MSRLKFPYHFRIIEFQGFLNAYQNTPEEQLAGWKKIATTTTLSTQALMLSLWWTWNRQASIPTILNPLYIEWMYRDVPIIWPYGSVDIPVGICGIAKNGWAVCNMDYENAIS